VLTCLPIISKIILLKGGFPKRWDKRLTQKVLHSGRIMVRILYIEGYLHGFTFYSVLGHLKWHYCPLKGTIMHLESHFGFVPIGNLY